MEIVETVFPIPDHSGLNLLRKARAGDERAFTDLYRSHADALYRYALHMSGRAEIAEEVLQETFLTLLRGSLQYDPNRGDLRAYLYGIARNRVRKHIALGREFEEPDLETAVDVDVLLDLTRKETIELVRKAVLALPGVYREVVVLCDLQELSYEQAADVIGCPAGTVRSRLFRGRGILLSKLQRLRNEGYLG